MIVVLAIVRELGFAKIANLVVFYAFEVEENVVFVGVEVCLTILVYVVLVAQTQRVYGKLVDVFFFLFEGIFQFTHIFQPLVTESIGYEEAPHEMGVEVGRGHTAYSQT